MSLRRWATPVTAGSFLLIAGTGVLMFFHLDQGLNKVAHEWLGWVLLIGAAAHLLQNWRAFTTYFKRPLAVGIMAAGVVVLALSSVPLSSASSEVPVREVLAGLAQAPIATLAEVADKDPAAVLASLSASYPGATLDQSLAELAGNDVEAGVHLLSQVYALAKRE